MIIPEEVLKTAQQIAKLNGLDLQDGETFSV